MLSPEQFFPFLLTAVVLTMTPGPDNLMVLGMGMARGRKHGIAFGLGCAFGCLSHTLLAVVGVSALIAASPTAFTVLKVAGGLYLIKLGWGAWRHAGAVDVARVDTPRETPLRLFFKGCIANAINPKVVLFFLSFLPQFVVPAHGDAPLQMAALGVTFTLQAAVLFGLLGWFAGAIGRWLNRRPRAGVVLDRVAGTVFIGLGLKLIVSR
ncbi:threonine/homoserine/homoserine lactone efflux protein [Pseudoduganella flava]|uniref:LysE family transporter n=1 Tax=Pseudoduganella flava TaxID=871742 RepID=A0A562PZH3_9BURK|nr:LysE family translocator [Pseudoduganella flava]QGZ38591.1 LysE family transporter [Pseudoduganella flava]TWI49842.1 threonine/homoserine/homoserine lactone efflux protein [Pseudoduganella flava]